MNETKFTPEFITQQRDLADQAIPEPWEASHHTGTRTPDVYTPYGWLSEQADGLPENDAELIAAFRNHYPAALDEIERLQAENDRLETALQRIQNWSEAYPLTVFPEPDFKRAHDLLIAGGMTLDAIAASNMRHVVEGVGKIARAALQDPTP
jgi:hypothetical protein